jgi:hypothetical protein
VQGAGFDLKDEKKMQKEKNAQKNSQFLNVHRGRVLHIYFLAQSEKLKILGNVPC